MDVEEFRSLVDHYGRAEYKWGRGVGGHFHPQTVGWNKENRDRLADQITEELQALSKEFDSLRAEVTDYKAKAAHWEQSWLTQGEVNRNLCILLDAYQNPTAAALVSDLAAVEDAVPDPELWRAGVKLLHLALKGEK